MAETFEAYTGRILGYARGRDPQPIMRATPRTLEKKVSRRSRRTLTRPPAPGKWSIGQILAHLAEMEMLWGYRIRTMLEQNGPAVIGMDQDAWARNHRYDRLDPRQSLEMFRVVRQANLVLLRRLSPKQMARFGKHSQFGRLTIRRITEFLAGHDINHTRQIDAILGKR